MNAARGARGVNEGTRRGEEGLRLRLSLESVRCALVLRNSHNDARREAGTPPGANVYRNNKKDARIRVIEPPQIPTTKNIGINTDSKKI